MKKQVKALCTLGLISLSLLSSCRNNVLVVYTEAGFAPFEYIKGMSIVGVDVEIMQEVGKKLNKKIQFENISFDLIIDIVKEGNLSNVGAAGLSITEERKEKVNFSHEYYQANLCAIYNINNVTSDFTKTMTDGNIGTYWSSLNSQKGIGVQIGTTADLFLSEETIEGGSLENTQVSYYSKLDTAVKDIGLNIDYVIIDELPAKQLIKNNENLNYVPLYYEGDEDEQAYDSYAIAVTKGQNELLNTINEVLDEMLNTFDKNGLNYIEQLINKHLGI
ncbi:MAG: transporter substrate-binding domain-containing protein [Bacilli bacterium]